MQKAGVGGQGALKPTQLSQRIALAAQKGAKVAGDGRILRVRQTQLRQATSGAAEGWVRHRHLREEAFQQALRQLFTGDLGADGPADQLGASAGHHHGHRGHRGVGQQRFFGLATSMCQRPGLPGVQLRALAGQLARHAVGQCQVHVVAAQQNVVTHRHALQGQFAVLGQHGHQRQIGGATADIDHQDEVAALHLVAPLPLAALDPAVQGRLWLFQQGQMRVARKLRRFGGEFAGARIKRGRDGDRDVLGVKRVIRMRLIPSGTQVRQVAHRGLHG